jgi:glycosyltransferase involved in cell wall biosynthesis
VAGVNDRIDNWFEAHTGRLTDAITTVSDDLRARTVAHGYDPERIYYLPNGCRVDEFAPGDAGAARVALGLPSGRPILLYVAVGTYDASLVLDVMQMLPALGHRDVLAVMLGLIGDDVRRDITRRGLENDVLVPGWVDTDRLRVYLQAADVGLMPQADTPFNRSRFPIKVGDYLASGLPVATMQVGEVGRLVADSGAGVATAADAGSFGRGVAELLAQPRGELRRLARRTAEGLSWDVVAARAEDIYRRTISGREISRGRRLFPSMLARSTAGGGSTLAIAGQAVRS